MKILVPIKRVPDPDQKLQVKADGSGIVTEGLAFVMNPFDGTLNGSSDGFLAKVSYGMAISPVLSYHSDDNELNLYPNPAIDIVNIALPKPSKKL